MQAVGVGGLMNAGFAEQDEVYSRAFRTKMDIARAFDRLCGEQPFSKVRVEAIAKEAGISRSSFYYHFDDRNAVVQWLSLHFYASGIDQTGRTLTWFEGHMNTTNGFRQFRTLFTSAADSNEYSAGGPFFMRHRQENLAETIVEYRHLELTDRLRFQVEALPHAEKVMTDNFERGLYRYTLKEFCELMVSLVPKDLYEALENPLERTSAKGDFFRST